MKAQKETNKKLDIDELVERSKKPRVIATIPTVRQKPCPLYIFIILQYLLQHEHRLQMRERVSV